MSEKITSAGRRYGPNRQMLRRTLFLMAVCGIAAFSLLLARLFKLQIIDHSYYEELAIRQQLREAPTSAARGIIYDRNMNPLAVSASVDNVYLSPAEIEMYGEDKELIADGLADILGLDRDDILKKRTRPARGMSPSRARSRVIRRTRSAASRASTDCAACGWKRTQSAIIPTPPRVPPHRLCRDG